MTTQEQLEKLIQNLNYRLDSDNEDTVIPKIASAILSAMRIDENRLRYLLEEIDPVGMLFWERGMKVINLTLASHAQEIIKFEEE